MQRLIQLLSASYLSEDRLERCHEHSEIVKCGYFGIRPLALLTGISHFIVNSERAKRVVEQELAPDVPVRVDVAYHSIDRISVRAGAPFQRNDPNELIIGHFGIPHAVKGTPKVLAAASILRETVPVRVLLAGWHAKAYLEHNVVPADRDHIILVDAPSDEELFRCMKWVDVAVQLREENYGESSGIVAQLIGVGKKPITTVNLIDESMIGRAIPVPNDIEPKDLARVITKSISRCTHEDDLSGVSSEKLGVLVSRLVLAGHDRS
jgi:glycosyltransferase involved in cell wall biosynthesis